MKASVDASYTATGSLLFPSASSASKLPPLVSPPPSVCLSACLPASSLTASL